MLNIQFNSKVDDKSQPGVIVREDKNDGGINDFPKLWDTMRVNLSNLGRIFSSDTANLTQEQENHPSFVPDKYDGLWNAQFGS